MYSVHYRLNLNFYQAVGVQNILLTHALQYLFVIRQLHIVIIILVLNSRKEKQTKAVYLFN